MTRPARSLLVGSAVLVAIGLGGAYMASNTVASSSAGVTEVPPPVVLSCPWGAPGNGLPGRELTALAGTLQGACPSDDDVHHH